MIELREATSFDREAILELRARCFPDDDTEKRDPRFWEWEFRDARMFVATEEARIVAHLGFLRQSGSYLAVDAMTDPDYRRRHVFSRVACFAREAIASDVAFSTAWQIRRPVRGGMEAGGWTEADGARVLMRPILGALLRRAGEREAASGERGAAASRHEDGLRLAARPSPLALSAIGGKPASWLSWRYYDNPLWTYDITSTDDAYLITRVTKLKGIDTLAIVDVAWRNGRKGEAGTLLRGALRRAPVRLAATLVTRAHAAYWWFVRHGFLPGPYRFRLLVNDFAHKPLPRWALMWGDTDHL
jgi:hypothetical protein